ncbi:hypothetical protein EV368DRAFT_87236 [Lentinula lateritia]|nr:hypothetical protein EV368DRAFT_87236 [Lentinula lateritia]
MSSWPTAIHLTEEVAQSLQGTIVKECKVSVYCNTLTEDYHVFIMQSTDSKLFFVHLPVFNMENHSLQLIIMGEIPIQMRFAYIGACEKNPDTVYLLVNDTPTTLNKILAVKEFDLCIEPINPKDQQLPIVKGKITNIKFLTPYPTYEMPFYVDGSEAQKHIDHVYTASPNIQMTAEQVVIGCHLQNDWNSKTVLYAQLPFVKSSMHPFTTNFERETALKPFFFCSDVQWDHVLFTKDLAGKEVVTTTSLRLQKKECLY